MNRINIIARVALAFALGISSPIAISQSPDESQTAKQTKASKQESEGVRRLGDLPYQEEHSSPYIQFLSEREGWMAIGRKLFRTEDGGEKWECLFDGGMDKYGDSNFICAFQFINSEVGWVRMFDEMLKTEDGGKTWNPFPQPIHSILTKSRNKGWLCAFRFLEAGKRGWVGGGVYHPVEKDEEVPPARFQGYEDNKPSCLFAAVFYTEDGGKSWKEQPVTRSAGEISYVYFLDAEHGWAIGEAGIFYLENGEWKATESDPIDEEKGEYNIKSLEIGIGAPTVSPSEVFFLNSQSGWMSNSNGYVGRSTDGGKTWADLLDPGTVWVRNQFDPLSSFGGLFFTNPTDGCGLDSNGDLHKTGDGGLTWTKTITGLELKYIQFLNDHLALGVSKDGLYRIALQ